MNISSLKIIGIFIIIIFCLSPLSAIDLNQYDNNKSTDNESNYKNSIIEEIKNAIENNESEYKIEEIKNTIENNDSKYKIEEIYNTIENNDSKYKIEDKEKDFNLMLKPNLSMKIDDVLPGEQPVIKVYADKSYDGFVQIACPSKFYYRYNAHVSNGHGEVTLRENLTTGYYDVRCWSYAKDEYEADECYATFRVGGTNDPKLSAEMDDVYEGQRPVITVYGEEKVSGDLNVSCPQFERYYLLYINHGHSQCSLDEYDLAPGNYTVKVFFEGSDKYRPGETTTSLTVKEKVNPDISMEIDDVYEGTKPVARIQSNTDFKGKVNLKLDKSDKVYTVNMSNGSGTVEIDEDLKIGNYTATISYDGDEKFKPCNATEKFEVMEKLNLGLSMEIDDTSYGHSTTAHIKCHPDFKGEVILKKGIYAYDKIPVKMRDGKGSSKLDDLELGNYTAIVSYDGDEKFKPCNATANFTVKKFANLTINVTGSPNTPTADIRADSGIMDLVRVKSNVSDSVYTAVLVNGHGYVGFGNFEPGNYTVTAYYAGNEEYAEDLADTTFTVT